MKMITEALGGLAIAFRTLTILSIPGRNAERMASALPWFPIVGLTLGLIIYGSASAWIMQHPISGRKCRIHCACRRSNHSLCHDGCEWPGFGRRRTDNIQAIWILMYEEARRNNGRHTGRVQRDIGVDSFVLGYIICKVILRTLFDK